MNVREQKGFELASKHEITQQHGFWVVPSQTTGKKYLVCADQQFPSCTCADFELNHRACKHVHAVWFTIKWAEEGRPAPDAEPPKPKRKTYPQVWDAYNAAQSCEKHRFQVLLHDMCKGIREPERHRPKGGRPPLLLADVVFAACFKIYSTFSGRRFMSDLRDAHERGYVTKAIHYNSIFSYLDNPELTPILRAMVTISSLPLKLDLCPLSAGVTSGNPGKIGVPLFLRYPPQHRGLQKSRRRCRNLRKLGGFVPCEKGTSRAEGGRGKLRNRFVGLRHQQIRALVR